MDLRSLLLTLIWRVSNVFHQYQEGAYDRAPLLQQLRVMLQRHPRWMEGHGLLAEEALRVDDVETAYASAHALLQITQGKSCKEAHHAAFILGRCYLRRGNPTRAINVLKPLLNQHTKHQSKLKEELAAAYMACGELQSASSILGSIPTSEISREGAAALSYVELKVSSALSKSPQD